MQCAVFEWIIRHKPIFNVLLLFADELAQFRRTRSWNWDGARKVLIVVYNFGRSGRRKDAIDDVVSIIVAHAAENRIHVTSLTTQVRFDQIAQVKPNCDRKTNEQ